MSFISSLMPYVSATVSAYIMPIFRYSLEGAESSTAGIASDAAVVTVDTVDKVLLYGLMTKESSLLISVLSSGYVSENTGAETTRMRNKTGIRFFVILLIVR